MEIIQKELRHSSLYWELKEKYLMKRIRLFVFLALVFWVAYLCQLVVATASVPVVVNILR